MPFKTLLSYVDHTDGDARRLAAAIAAARRFDAHLSVVAVGYIPEIVADPYPGIAAPAYEAQMHAQVSVEAKELAKTTTDKILAEAVRGDARPMVTTPSMFSQGFGERARFTDLVVLQWSAEAKSGARSREAFEAALFQGGATILLCPDDPDLRPKRAMIAWDGSASALGAVRRARPILREVEEIEICMVDPNEWQARSAEELAVMLSRYGQTASIFRAESDGGTEAEALVRRQIESGAGLTVLGGYGHSRFREMLLGGVTRQMPQISKTPLLMAH